MDVGAPERPSSFKPDAECPALRPTKAVSAVPPDAPTVASLGDEREWVSHESGPIAILNRPNDTFKNALTMAVEMAPRTAPLGARFNRRDRLLVGPHRRHHVEHVGDRDDPPGQADSVPAIPLG